MSILVYGLFCPSISRTELCKPYTFNSDLKAWQKDMKKKDLREEDMVLKIYIIGSLFLGAVLVNPFYFKKLLGTF